MVTSDELARVKVFSALDDSSRERLARVLAEQT